MNSIKTKVVHSETKSAWNVIGDTVGGKYKIARVPYVVATDDEEITTRYRLEALEHANFISDSFNKDYESKSKKCPCVIVIKDGRSFCVKQCNDCKKQVAINYYLYQRGFNSD